MWPFKSKPNNTPPRPNYDEYPKNQNKIEEELRLNSKKTRLMKRISSLITILVFITFILSFLLDFSNQKLADKSINIVNDIQKDLPELTADLNIDKVKENIIKINDKVINLENKLNEVKAKKYLDIIDKTISGLKFVLSAYVTFMITSHAQRVYVTTEPQ